MESRSVKFSNKSILYSSRGVSLISALVAVALVGIMVLVLASMYENAAKVMQRSSMQREADNLYKYTAGILAQKGLCDNALRTTAAGGPGALITWINRNIKQDVNFVVQSNGAAPVSVIASASAAPNPVTGRPYNELVQNGLFVREIYVRSRDLNGDNVPDAPIETASQEHDATHDTLINYTSILAELVIEFRGPVDGLGNPVPGTQWIGGAFRQRAIPFVAKINAANQIERCDFMVSQNLNIVCNEATAALHLFPCGTCTAPLVAKEKILNWGGYDVNGNPICKCTQICDY